MAKQRRRGPPIRSLNREVTQGLLLLDRFSADDLESWKRRSEELDELYHTLYFGLEPERIKRRQEFLDALISSPGEPIEFMNWVRMVDWQWTNSPLSAVGSLKGHGGRFNVGADVDECGTTPPFPAIYIGSDAPTAYREYHQCTKEEVEKTGLTPDELALQKSATTVVLRGYIERVFDVTNLDNLQTVASVLRKFKTPPALVPIARRLKLPPASTALIRTAQQLQTNLQDVNWRRWPSQFGLPAPSQKFGEWVQAAGYEAIKFRSTKSPTGYCLAVFPDALASNRTHVEIVGSAPSSAGPTRLDMETSEALSGWNEVDIRTRRRATRRL